MNFKVEVDLDFIEEDGTINEQVKDQIILGIVSKINTKSKEEISLMVETQIIQKSETLISEKINTMMEDFLTKEISITDQWGDVKKKIVINDLVKEKFDKFMIAQVDEAGRDHNYGGGQPRVEWMIDKRVDKLCQQKAKEIVNDVEAKVREIFTAGLELKVKNKIITQLGLEDLLNEAKKITA